MCVIYSIMLFTVQRFDVLWAHFFFFFLDFLKSSPFANGGKSEEAVQVWEQLEENLEEMWLKSLEKQSD